MKLKNRGWFLIYIFMMGAAGGLGASAIAVTTTSTGNVRQAEPTSFQLAHADNQVTCYRTLRRLDMHGELQPGVPNGNQIIGSVPANEYVYTANSKNSYTGTLIWYKVFYAKLVGWIPVKQGTTWNISSDCTKR